MARLNVDFILVLLTASALCAQPQIGGNTCSNSILNGPYFWQLSGAVGNANVAAPAVELARIVADGKMSFSGVKESSYRWTNA